MRFRFFWITTTILVLFSYTISQAQDNSIAYRYLMSGQAFLEEGLETEGIRDLRTVVDSFAQTPHARTALLVLADYYQKNGLRDRTEKALNELINNYPMANEAGSANIRLGMMFLDTLSSSMAQTAQAKFSRVKNIFPNSFIVDNANLGLAKIYLRNRQLPEANAALTEILLNRRFGSIYTDALRAYAQLEVFLSQPADAMTSLQKIILGNEETEECASEKAALNLLIRHYIQNKKPLVQDPSFVVSGDDISRIMDLQWTEDNRLLMLDKKGILLSINPADSKDRRSSSVPDNHEHINLGYLKQTLTTGPDGIKTTGNSINFSKELKRIVDVTWSTPGEYWVIDRGYSSIQRFDETGSFTGTAGSFSFKGDEVICRDPIGGTWIMYPESEKFLYFNAAGDATSEMKFHGPGYIMERPVDMTLDRFGDLFVLDEKQVKIYVFNPSLKLISEYSLAVADSKLKPISIAIGNDGRIYIADKKTDSIYRFK